MNVPQRAVGLVAVFGLAAGVTGTASATAFAAEDLTVLSLNTWHGGTSVDDGLNKIVKQISESGAGVASLQEVDSAKAAEVAEALGWNHTNSGSDVDVISKYPIDDEANTTTESGARVAGAKIRGNWIYSVHLDYTHYGPYNACFDKDSYEEIYRDEATRKVQAEEVVAYVESDVPTIVAGDLNSPSQYDWTEKTKGAHCDSVVEWPATQAFHDGGYWDAYREVHPDEAADPGNTWSPVEKTNENGSPEPQDRIDFIQYEGGSLDAVSSSTYGQEGGDWPSDHLGVLTTFTS